MQSICFDMYMTSKVVSLWKLPLCQILDSLSETHSRTSSTTKCPNFNQNSRQSPERLLLYQPAVHSMALHTYIVPAWNNWLSELSAYRYFWTILIACTVHLGKCYIFRCLKMRLWHNWVKNCSQHFCWQRPQLSGSHTKRCFCRTGIWFLSLCFSPSVRACPR